MGCGPGNYLRRLASTHPGLRLIAADLSEGMVAEAVGSVPASGLVGDAQRLPLADRRADRVLAMHMLYHCDDIDAAVAELRRIVRPGGAVLVATNGGEHLGAFRELMAEVTGVDDWLPVAARFKIEGGGEVLGRHFSGVELHRNVAELTVPDPEPVVRYARSARAFAEPRLAAGVSWETAMERFEAGVRRVIDRDGAFRATVSTGVFVCR